LVNESACQHQSTTAIFNFQISVFQAISFLLYILGTVKSSFVPSPSHIVLSAFGIVT